MRLTIACVVAGALLAGAACSDGAAPVRPASVPAPSEVELGGVNLSEPLRILGTEPFWSVEVTAASLTLSSPDQPAQSAINPGPEVQGTIAIYRTETDADLPLVVTLTATECSDGMSDRLYPLTARVEIGDQSLTGCAASTAFIEAGPRP